MGKLWDNIRDAVAGERFFISVHADNECAERGIEAWHLAAGITEARCLAERPQTKPHPTCVAQHTLPTGEQIEAVWAWSPAHRQALVVTAYVPE